jgi:hypothetical protein
MSEDTEPIYQLSYKARRPSLNSRIAHWITRRPHWLIALGLMLAVMALSVSPLERFGNFWRADWYLPAVMLFLPGAIRRLSWRQALVMVATAGGQ